MVYSGYTAETPKHLLLDAGAFFKNFYVGTDTFESAKTAGKLLGATSGGGSFSAVPTVRQIEIDGIKGAAKGLQVLDSWSVSMKANVKEVKQSTIRAALVASEVDGASNQDYDIITANNTIELTDYIDNVTWVGTLAGSNDPVIIQVYNAISTSGLSLTFADKNEAGIPLEFTGHYVDTDLDTPPFKIYYPKPITNTVDTATHSFSKAAPADIVYTVTSSGGASCQAIKLGEQYLIETAFGLSAATVTVKKELLAGIANGAYDFALMMDKGNNIKTKITVGA